MNETPHPPRVNFDAIPEALRTRPFVLWRYETRDGRLTKVPYQPNGHRASSTDPSTWTDFETARRVYLDTLGTERAFAGVGIALDDGDELLGGDLDGCLHPDGTLESWAEPVLALLGATYTEVTPSGTGLRSFVLGERPEGTGNKKRLTNFVPSVPGPKDPEFEWDQGRGRYLTVTGQTFRDAPKIIGRPSPAALAAIWNYVAGLTQEEHTTATSSRETRHSAPVVRPPPVAPADDELLDKARRASNGDAFAALYDRGDLSAYEGDVSRGTAALLAHLAFWTGRDAHRMDALFRGSALMREKWDSRRGETTWGANEIARAIERADETYTPGHASASRGAGRPHGRPRGDAPGSDERAAETKPGADLLVVRSLPDWLDEAASAPAPRRLFGDCWFEGELSILFAETNVGKSILAVQIADAITRGRPAMQGFPVEGAGQPVLLLDFELSPKQFHGRYSEDYGRPYAFAPGFLRAEVNPDFDFEGEWATLINDAIEAAVLDHDVRVVIVDNITYLRDETERAKGALPLMRHLNALKKRHGLSLLALAHTPKRDASNPIGRNDLAGSRRLLDFCDSCFALGESHRDEGLRYLKQVKVRQAEFTLDGGNVALLSLAKRDGFLRFDLDGYAPEADHLKSRKKEEDDELDNAIVEAARSAPGLSHREIARRIGTNHKRVGRVLARTEVGQWDAGTPVPPVPLRPTGEESGLGQGGTPGTPVPLSHRSTGDGLPDDIPPELLAAAPGWEDEDDAPLDYL